MVFEADHIPKSERSMPHESASPIDEDAITVAIKEAPECLDTNTRRKRDRAEFLRDYARIIEFTSDPSFHEDTRREILYQAVRMYSGHNKYFDHSAATWISEEAERLCHADGRPRASRTVIKEHVVPIGTSIDNLLKESTMTETCLKDLLDTAATICIISCGENELLNRAHLKTRMPASERWSRYDHPQVRIRRRPILELDGWVGGDRAEESGS